MSQIIVSHVNVIVARAFDQNLSRDDFSAISQVLSPRFEARDCCNRLFVLLNVCNIPDWRKKKAKMHVWEMKEARK